MLNYTFKILTDMGDSLVLGALSLTLAVYLLASGYRRESAAAIAGYGLPVVVVTLMKLAFYTCLVRVHGIVSPSGHAALSTGFMGICVLMAIKLCPHFWRSLVPLALLAIMMGICISRVALGMHTIGDVVVGAVVGLGSVIIISRVILKRNVAIVAGQANILREKPVHPAYLLLSMVIVGFLSYGVNLPSDRFLREVARQYAIYPVECLEN